MTGAQNDNREPDASTTGVTTSTGEKNPAKGIASTKSGGEPPLGEQRGARRTKAVRALAILGGLFAVCWILWQGWLPGTWRIRAFGQERAREYRIGRFAAAAKDVPPGRVVFIGSSTIYRFPFEKLYPGAPYLNRGLGSETATDLLMRLDASLPVARPHGVVIYTGANDVRADAIPTGAALIAVDAVIRYVRARWPDVPLCIVEALTVVDEPERTVLHIRALNDGLRELAKQYGAAFVATNRPEIMDANGRMAPHMSPDKMHLTEEGYAYFARWIAEEGGEATAPLRAGAR